MEKDKTIEEIRKSIQNVLVFKDRSLVTRPQWGDLNFSEAELDIKRLFDLSSHLQILPLEFLTDTALAKIRETLNQCPPILADIDNFSLKRQSSPSSEIHNYSSRLHQAVDHVYSESAIWLPFLAYQNGDVSTNINKLNQTIKVGETLLEEAKTEFDSKKGEIDQILIATREAAASAGVAVFTEEFAAEARMLRKTSRYWLIATVLFTIAVGGVAIWTWVFPINETSKVFLWQMLSSKLILISVLLTAALWCGRIYKALLHQSAVNRQKALGLKTFQAFTQAASDTQTKDAVLRATTHSIFAQMLTGYIDNKGATQEGDSKIIEIARAISLDKQ